MLESTYRPLLLFLPSFFSFFLRFNFFCLTPSFIPLHLLFFCFSCFLRFYFGASCLRLVSARRLPPLPPPTLCLDFIVCITTGFLFSFYFCLFSFRNFSPLGTVEERGDFGRTRALFSWSVFVRLVSACLLAFEAF